MATTHLPAPVSVTVTRRQLHTQQLLLFQHLAAILRRIAEHLPVEDLTPTERRAMQRELAQLKKTAQAARRRLKAAHASRHAP